MTSLSRYTPAKAKEMCDKNVRAWVSMVSYLKYILKMIPGKKKSWEPFGICLLKSTANLAHFHPNWAGLTVLFSRQIPNSSHYFFSLTGIIFLKFFGYETIETYALTFL